MADNKTILQRLTNVLIGVSNNNTPTMSVQSFSPSYNIDANSEIIYQAKSQKERDEKLQQLKQQRYLAYQWAKTGYDTSMEQLPGATQVKVMYRDADLMDQWPEINAGLHIVSQEATTINSKGKMLNIYSKSSRIQTILEDLFVNRLDIHCYLPMIVRASAKYGNEFMFLNIDQKNGIRGWRELPVHEMRRIENGMQSAYGGGYANVTNLKPDEVKFIWEGHNEDMLFKNWQIAHFRLISDSLYLPYGVSWLNGARRHWRMLSMMEDAMLLYRLEKSIERRIYKVNVGLIDDADVPAFLQEFMNNVKRAPIIDPQTGQMDLRKNFLDVSADYVIPVRPGQDPTSIDVLQSNTNQTSMDDIQHTEKKILAMLRIPKSFLNFQEEQGKAQNLSLMDIRFNRTINSIQQSILMELNKIAMIHLYLLGFEDELTNFSLSLNNPSNQLEQMELDNLNKRLAAAQTALADQGGGIPIMSWHQVQKEIMGRTDAEISDLLSEIRLESAVSTEIQRTAEIIKRTHLFDKVDRIYGEPDAEYSAQPVGQDGGPMGGGGIGGPMPQIGGDDDFGANLGDLGEPNSDETSDISGDMGGADLESMGDNANSPSPLNESLSITQKKRLLNEKEKSISLNYFFNSYLKKLQNINEEKNTHPSIIDEGFRLNEELDDTLRELDKHLSSMKTLIED